MKKLTIALLFTGALFAQSASFTFGAINPPPYPYPPQQCAQMLTWNNAPADPNDTGSICLAIYPYGSTNIDIPQTFGFPNNGFLTGCKTVPSPIGFGTPGFHDNGDGTGTQSFTANNCYDGLNTTLSVTIQWKRYSHLSCGHGRCITTYSWQVNSGEGTVVN